jgi:hypothetical protein
VTAVDGVALDYFVRAVRVNQRDELQVSAVSTAPPAQWPTISATAEAVLSDKFGVKIPVTLVGPGELDAITQVATSKPKRFRDERSAPA